MLKSPPTLGQTPASTETPADPGCENCGTKLFSSSRYRGRLLCLNCFYEENALSSLKKRGMIGFQRHLKF